MQIGPLTWGALVNDSHRLGISELRSSFARGNSSPKFLVQTILNRIEQLNPRLQAFIEVDEAGALQAADESEVRYAEDSQRPLEGVVVGVKANIAVKGLELNAGMAARQGLIADADAEAVTKLRDAGAIIIGTLNMHEAAIGPVTDNPFFGRCLNPHGENRSPGGSSGGSASAVAAGLCTVSLGTDTLGSVRIPSSYCGLYGLKPGAGAVSSEGLIPFSRKLDAIGGLARSMDDLSFLSNILVAPDISMALQRSRFLTLEGFGGTEPEMDVAQAFQHATAALRDAPSALALPYPLARTALACFALATRELAVHLVDLGEERCSKLSDDASAWLEIGLGRDNDLLAEDAEILAATRAALLEAVGANAILITPTTPQTAFAHGTQPPMNIADFTALANLSGLPAISIPCGRDSQGMPIGLQLIGPLGGEALLIAQARSINDRLKAYAPPTNWW